ncbi:hypothetical protein P153DRAFT_100106 [Dothidotthia symphoricarpi CBS 119687]|uniref:Uncharacterized protein n=1 Tax=Dothidotthia symphoricarpi CBS 119687 TaxID=1392245 RepID=A0A6A6ARL6_9PLEO|nr:uncharacterized protein P153DRAFT_100106 [Dothidotthia symphoricarpi CBS 119687]KAF2133853.1 hypothetical protein P153DRAFT_100106 [Dothidotthia symphoricarpi CBS 119687]
MERFADRLLLSCGDALLFCMSFESWCNSVMLLKTVRLAFFALLVNLIDLNEVCQTLLPPHLLKGLRRSPEDKADDFYYSHVDTRSPTVRI